MILDCQIWTGLAERGSGCNANPEGGTRGGVSGFAHPEANPEGGSGCYLKPDCLVAHLGLRTYISFFSDMSAFSRRM